MASDSHKKSKDEAINISKLHDHLKKNTPSGIKIKERSLQVGVNKFNKKYLESKRNLLSHTLGEI